MRLATVTARNPSDTKSCLRVVELPWPGPRTVAVKCMSDENTGAKQAEEHGNCLSHRNVPLHLARTKRLSLRTVKEFRRFRKIGT